MKCYSELYPCIFISSARQECPVFWRIIHLVKIRLFVYNEKEHGKDFNETRGVEE